MGTRGPAPEPSAITRAKGNPAKKKLNREEPQPQLKAPRRPTNLSKEAKREWTRIVPKLLEVGLLTELDSAVLAMYCDAYGTWVKASKKVNEEGEVVQVGKYSYPQQNPWLTVKNKAIEQMNKSLSELGLSPSARTRIRTKAGKPMTERQKAVAKILGNLDERGIPTGPGAKA